MPPNSQESCRIELGIYDGFEVICLATVKPQHLPERLAALNHQAEDGEMVNYNICSTYPNTTTIFT